MSSAATPRPRSYDGAGRSHTGWAKCCRYVRARARIRARVRIRGGAHTPPASRRPCPSHTSTLTSSFAGGAALHSHRGAAAALRLPRRWPHLPQLLAHRCRPCTRPTPAHALHTPACALHAPRTRPAHAPASATHAPEGPMHAPRTCHCTRPARARACALHALRPLLAPTYYGCRLYRLLDARPAHRCDAAACRASSNPPPTPNPSPTLPLPLPLPLTPIPASTLALILTRRAVLRHCGLGEISTSISSISASTRSRSASRSAPLRAVLLLRGDTQQDCLAHPSPNPNPSPNPSPTPLALTRTRRST